MILNEAWAFILKQIKRHYWKIIPNNIADSIFFINCIQLKGVRTPD
ncbi:MAG: hypothetical protein ACI9M9_000737 [Flavobacteriaceae bacterium]|jgi:hypothetical protein